MAIICSSCGKVHYEGVVSCEQSEEMHKAFLRRVEHHSQHCDCSNPESHQRSIENSKKRGPMRLGTTG